MFKVNNKDTRTTPGIVLVSLLLTLNIFHTLFSAFIVNFGQVIAGWDVFRKDCFMVFTTSRSPYVILCHSLMTVQTSDGKVPHTYKELIRIIMAFEYEKLPPLKSPQNKVVSNIVIRQARHMSGAF